MILIWNVVSHLFASPARDGLQGRQHGSRCDSTLAAAQRPTVDLYTEVFEKKLNQKGLSSAYTGALEICSTKPLKVKDDWKGILVGAINPESAALAESLGASPVVVMWTDSYAALEKGIVDACFNGIQWMIVAHLSDVSSYVSE